MKSHLLQELETIGRPGGVLLKSATAADHRPRALRRSASV